MAIEMKWLTDYAPVSQPGDYWFRSSGQVGGETFTAVSYHDSTTGQNTINTLDTTMTDLTTPQGIRVGDSRAQVLQAYPEALTGSYQGQYPAGSDMLTFLPNSDHDPNRITDLSQLSTSRQAGPAILFFFDGNTLSQITLTNAPR